MSLSREEAWAHLCQWTETDSLRKHARAVELVMRRAAHRYGEAGSRPDEEELWGIAGMLHDADYEKWPEDHPNRTVTWLRERGEERLAYAISAHYTQWNIPYQSALDRALLACDELTGFVVACCLVRPEGISTLEPKSVRKKLKDKAFAAKVDRREIDAGASLLGVELSDHIAFVIEALKPHAEELGITGRNLQAGAQTA
jgi:predicted hydrolase (HD superfamily)